MSAPKCPTALELKALIDYYDDFAQNSAASCEEESEMIDKAGAVTNALRYLETFLTNRRYYQRKMQIKRKVLTKLAAEQGWMEQVDNAVKALHGEDIENLSLADEEEDTDAS